MLALSSLGRWSLAAAVAATTTATFGALSPSSGGGGHDGRRSAGAAATAAAVAESPVVFTGRVLDATTGEAVRGAEVTMDETRTARSLTGGDGRYAFTVSGGGSSGGVRRGVDRVLRARRAGYAPAAQTVRVVGDTVRADFALVPSATVLSSAATDSTAAAAATPASVNAAPARKTEAQVVVTGAATEQRQQQRREMRDAAAATQAYSLPASPPPGYVPSNGGALARVSPRNGAAAGYGGGVPPYIRRQREPGNTEAYDRIDENPFLSPRTAPLSTFGIDVDRASYSNVRRFVEQQGALPPKDAVRLEELVNYFPYDLPAPRGAAPVAITAETHEAPWHPGHRLVRLALQARKIDVRDLPPSNLVFLIDVSGSMMSPDKLPLVKSAFRLLVDQLREQDRVAIVVYAGNAGLVLPSTSGSDKQRILAAIDRLEAGGSTAGGAGIRLAYDVARANHLARGNNRVILATDGDFNVGTSSDAELERLIESRRDEGTFLTVLGFGTGNLKDAKMEKLADRGNGNYAYVDGALEANKVFVHELGGTLLTVAKDVKLQVEFNPDRVAAYRLLGYENRLLRDEDFNDDAKDAGDMGAGHSVTALYEVVPVGASDAASVIRSVDPLRYRRPSDDVRSGDEGPVRDYAVPATPPPTAARVGGGGSELLYVKLRYKEPDGHTSRKMEQAVYDAGIGSGDDDDRREARASTDYTFAAAVAEFALVLRDSEHRGQATLSHALAAAQRSLGRDEGGYRAGFVELVKKARELKEGDRPIAVERE